MRRSRFVLVALLLSSCVPDGYTLTWNPQGASYDVPVPHHANFDFSPPSILTPAAPIDLHDAMSQPQASTPPIQYRTLWPDTFGSPYDH